MEVGVSLPMRQRFFDVVRACVYTSKTPDQLKHAERKGLLKVRIAKDGSKSYAIEDLDDYMGFNSKTD